MILTKHGATPLELAEEFISNMQKMPSGGKDADTFTQFIASQELTPVVSPRVYEQIKNVSGTGYDATTVHMISEVGISYNPILLSFICTQSRAIPEFINTMLGLYAVKFYSDHPSSDTLTLTWVLSQIGQGKIIGHTHFFPYAMAARDKKNRNIFDYISKKDVFTYTK